MQNAVGVAVALPGVVDVDVDVARVFHAGRDELVGGVAHVLIRDIAVKEVPTIPAHGRGLRHPHLRWGRLLDWIPWNFRRRYGLGNGGERKQGKNGGSEGRIATHRGNLLKTF